jgi:hypothetical protein
MSSPKWLAAADRALTLASDRIRVIRAVTPRNAESELASLEESFRRGLPRLPRWEYDRDPIPAELCSALEGLADFLEGVSPLGRLYGGRAREMCAEAAIVDAVGTPQIRGAAARRFIGRSPDDLDDLKEADELADEWADPAALEPNVEEDRDLVRTCDESDPRSLVSSMSREAGRCRLPMRVVVEPTLASLAATGDGVIFVAAGRWVGPRDVSRTVLHEIAGHALPRARSACAKVRIFVFGTARGTDDQEGRALMIERSAGFLDAPRRRELGLRHLGARATLDGATFVDVVELLRRRRASIGTALRIAARVQRGGSGSGGLGREVVYIPSLLRVERHLSVSHRIFKTATVEELMSAGRIAADLAPSLSLALAAEQVDELAEDSPLVTSFQESYRVDSSS